MQHYFQRHWDLGDFRDPCDEVRYSGAITRPKILRDMLCAFAHRMLEMNSPDLHQSLPQLSIHTLRPRRPPVTLQNFCLGQWVVHDVALHLNSRFLGSSTAQGAMCVVEQTQGVRFGKSIPERKCGRRGCPSIEVLLSTAVPVLWSKLGTIASSSFRASDGFSLGSPKRGVIRLIL